MPYWVCEYHKRHLEPAGHLAGPGIECWPGISYNYETHEWFLDSSELACPGLDASADDAEMGRCGESWEWVEEVPWLQTQHQKGE
jgi:hypothetical protein